MTVRTSDPYDPFDADEPPRRWRRFSRAQVTVLAALAALVLVVGAIVALDDGDGPPQQVSAGGDDTDPPAPSAHGSTSTTGAAEPSSTTTSAPATSTTVEVAEGIEEWPPVDRYGINDPSVMVGRAVGPDGEPVREPVFVYTGPTFRGIPQPVTTTDADGWYQIACPASPVVLSGTQLSTFAGDHARDRNLAPTLVAMPDGTPLQDLCGSGGIATTRLALGGVIEGDVRNLDATTGTAMHIPLGLPWPTTGDCQGMPTCYFLEVPVISTSAEDGTFRVVGVPPGRVTLSRTYSRPGSPAGTPLQWRGEVVHVEAGEVTRVDWEIPDP